jgi:hypothetical protein
MRIRACRVAEVIVVLNHPSTPRGDAVVIIHPSYGPIFVLRRKKSLEISFYFTNLGFSVRKSIRANHFGAYYCLYRGQIWLRYQFASFSYIILSLNLNFLSGAMFLR